MISSSTRASAPGFGWRTAFAVAIGTAALLATPVAAQAESRKPAAPAAPDSTAPPKAPTNVGPPPQTSNALSAVAAANNADGRLEAVWNDAGTILHAYQLTPNGGWSASAPLTSALTSPIRSAPVMQLDGQGRLEVVIDTDDGTYNAWQVAPNSYWSDWSLIGPGMHRPGLGRLLGPSGCGNTPQPCGVNIAPLVIYYGVAAGGQLMRQEQSSPGGYWLAPQAWMADPGGGDFYPTVFNDGLASPGRPMVAFASATTSLVCGNVPYGFTCTTMGPPPGGFPVPGPLGANLNADGRAELYTVGGDGSVYHSYETTFAGIWSGWQSLSSPNAGIPQGTPQVQLNTNGTLELVIPSADGGLWHTFQTAPNSAWGGWYELGSTFPGFSSIKTLAVAVNADGRLEEFTGYGVGGTGLVIGHAFQEAPSSGPWSGIYGPL